MHQECTLQGGWGGTCNNVSTSCEQIVLQAGTKFDYYGPVHKKGVGT